MRRTTSSSPHKNFPARPSSPLPNRCVLLVLELFGSSFLGLIPFYGLEGSSFVGHPVVFVVSEHVQKLIEDPAGSGQRSLPSSTGRRTARTKNYSGTELEGVVRSAVSYALNRQISFDDLTKLLDEESIKITMDDFLNALHEVGPAFGASMDDLERRRLNGIIDCGERHKHIQERALLLVEQIKDNQSPLVTYLLEGPTGSGKTSMAATIGIESDFPYVKMISAESMIGLGEATKCAQIVKVIKSRYINGKVGGRGTVLADALSRRIPLVSD
ncbi:hypothetical protein ZIOFF_027139 [Zingiber officinale]|uniref:Vesicle-fusing ATPase n=1 Tax=Zingiber officinale TaxID=94328 RepID=A0A8J5H5W6_ZINOF|nr:hypothetical protein ZIOFF_027139 [Zingiber officinale]